ncbi:DUF4115 domain-containing protein [Halomonas eurihalina]|uniref:DUF4115 domain-containing protein n=1 Tax=Halomonas eurihalina TaxID=42566 RepID=A0A5D9CQR1_HALER|nr:RodZ domain-containing protein [Halomonas eurihalina]MDR5859833.1 DUF4115 domain-containing protein [Halomonas eurihalina]TZG33636.1 DUF4115 domain-containing protein [Halomonas eurihalina]
MSDTPLQEPDAVTPQASPGELLRRERNALELSREEVAAALNLRPAVIDGLERDSYEEIPVATYRRGYLRSYANLLGLDENRVLAAYKAHFGQDDEHKVTPVHIVSKPPSRLGAWLFRLATLVVIAGLIGLTLMWWQSRGGSQPPSPSDNAPVAVDGLDGSTTVAEDASSTGDATPAPEETSETTENVASDAEASAPTDGEPELLPTADDAPVAATPEAPGDASTAEDTATAEGDDASADADNADADNTGADNADAAESEQAAQADPRVMNLTFNEQSWTEIFDANNQRVFVGLQEPGTTARVEGDPPFRLTVGNATGVELNWGGESVDLSEHAGANNVARFTLGE